jgi:hypothetical protein
VVDALVGVKAPWMVLGLHFAGDEAFLVRRIEPCDPPGAGFSGDQIVPGRFHVTAKRGDETKSGYDDATHVILRKCNRLNLIEAEPAYRFIPDSRNTTLRQAQGSRE